MGISGLLPFIKNACRPANIRDFRGSTVVVDAYSWLHKGAFSCAERLVKGEKTDGYVHYCMKQLNMLLDAGLTPIMVFDGCNLESKAVTEKKRRENREKTKQKGKELLCQGKVKEARECFQRCVDVTPEMALEVIMACKAKNVDYIVAPYEADAQMAYLNKINVAQLVITEDSDLVVFGCERILFKMDGCGGGLLYEKENLPKVFGMQAEKMSFEKFRFMCILSGCDYLPSLPGIGLAKARKFMMVTSNPNLETILPKLPSYLQMAKLVVTSEYVKDFLKANNTFLYQLVFCPKNKELVPLNPYPKSMDPTEMEYAGKYIPSDLAVQIAQGEINVNTMREFNKRNFESSQYRYKRQNNNDTSSGTWNSGMISPPKQKTEKSFKFRQNLESLQSSDSKKQSKVTFESSETCELMKQDEMLFSSYNMEKSPVKKQRSVTTDHHEVVNENQENKSSTKLPSTVPLPFRKTLSPNTVNLPKESHQNPFRKIVKSRFFSDPEDDKPKRRKLSKLDSIDEEYNTVSNKLKKNILKDDFLQIPSDSECSIGKGDSIIFSVDVDFEKTNPKGSVTESMNECVDSCKQESSSCKSLNSLDNSYKSVESESLPSSASCDMVLELMETDSLSAHETSSTELCEVVELPNDSSLTSLSMNSSPYFSQGIPLTPDCDKPERLFSSCPEMSSKPRSALTRCRAIGLPKTQRKRLVKQLSVQDTLFKFNFTKLKNGPSTSV